MGWYYEIQSTHGIFRVAALTLVGIVEMKIVRRVGLMHARGVRYRYALFELQWLIAL